MKVKFCFLFFILPFFSLSQYNENMDSELSNTINTTWYNAHFKNDEDSIIFYTKKLNTPQFPNDKNITLQNYHTKLSIFRNDLRAFVQQHSTDDLGAKALIIACLRNTEVDVDTLSSIAQMLTDQGLQNKYADYLFQEIRGRKNNRIGKMFVPFSMPDENGNTISSENYKGKYVLILYWASWCIPCRAEIPGLLSVYNQYKNSSFEVLAVSLDEDKNNWLQAIHHDKTDWQNLFDGKGWSTDAARNYTIHSIPQNLLLDTSGKIIAKNISTIGLQNFLSR